MCPPYSCLCIFSVNEIQHICYLSHIGELTIMLTHFYVIHCNKSFSYVRLNVGLIMRYHLDIQFNYLRFRQSQRSWFKAWNVYIIRLDWWCDNLDFCLTKLQVYVIRIPYVQTIFHCHYIGCFRIHFVCCMILLWYNLSFSLVWSNFFFIPIR